uniref:G_PROTEIN_RECEP_F1_2 domain-containing protein n=2 Tax=Caenorhabditis tropicalis TaxID=1561998 RepID=A0A1I7T0I2_9PELO
MTEETKKRYVFVISRCISSISASITLLTLRCILYVYFPPETSNYYLYATVIISNDISFYALQGSYIGMAVLLYIGVIKSVYFSNSLTLRKIYILAVSNWILAAVISFPSGAFQTATYIPGPIQCGSQHCSPVVGLINFLIVSFYFLLTVLILSFVFICLSFHIYQSKKLGSYTSSQTLHHARIRLGWTLFAIIIISLAEGIPAAFILGLKADSVLNTCNNFYQADRLVTVTIFTSIDSIVWSMVLILDPLASIFFDIKILEKVKRHVNRSKVYYARFLNSMSSNENSQ